jgi:hypothetical protein
LRGTRAAAVGARHELGDEPLEIGRVEDREARAEPGGLRLVTQDREAERMKGRDRRLLRRLGLALRGQKRLRAIAHLARGLVGERDRDNVRGIDAATDEMGDLSVITRVFPLPAPARTSSGPSQ